MGYTPEIGRVWYTGFAGAVPPWEVMLKDVVPHLRKVTRHIDERIEGLALKERVWAAQIGHTAIRLSDLAKMAGTGSAAPPQGHGQLIVLRGQPGITPEVARETLTEAGLYFG